MKKLVVIFIIIVILSIPAYLIYNNEKTQDDFYAQLHQFTLLLKNQEYEQAKSVYDESSDMLRANYNISLDGYAHELVEEAKKVNSTQESLDILYTYHEIGYKSTEVDNAIMYYEDLLQSNYIFEKALEHYNNKDFENAIECFNDVLEYDENYEEAQEYLNTFQQYTLTWKYAKENNEYGRSPIPNAIAYKDNFMYIPYEFNNSYSILKISASTYSILSFPIVSSDKGATISNINIVGDYIFFLLEQKNKSIDNGVKNAVYRISTTGENLTKIIECDYTHLISYRDEFYAISDSKGLVKSDYYFFNEEAVIETDSKIVQMQLMYDGIYYTLKDNDRGLNVVYFFDGQNSEEINKEVNMHYYHYGDDNIIYYDSNDFYEYLYHENMSNGSANNNQIYAGDMYKYYGLLHNNVIFTYLGDYQQECMRVRDIRKFKTTYRAEPNSLSYIPMGICYETGKVLLKSDGGISVTTESMRIEQTLSLPHIHGSVLESNEENITSSDEASMFSDKTITNSSEVKWQYSDENVNISTEKVFLDKIESNIYISHIYTNDSKWLQSISIDNIANPIETIEKIIWAIPAQAYDEEPTFINEERGILEKDVYVFNDDGLFIPYRAKNIIPAEKVLSNKVIYAFSQGEIIVENYEMTDAFIKDGGYLSGRSAIGMVEPGHYVSIVAEKSTDSNRGLSLYSLGKLFEKERCMSAYSFDSNHLFNIAFDEYVYETVVDSEEISKENQILYYSGE